MSNETRFPGWWSLGRDFHGRDVVMIRDAIMFHDRKNVEKP